MSPSYDGLAPLVPIAWRFVGGADSSISAPDLFLSSILARPGEGALTVLTSSLMEPSEQKAQGVKSRAQTSNVFQKVQMRDAVGRRALNAVMRL